MWERRIDTERHRLAAQLRGAIVLGKLDTVRAILSESPQLVSYRYKDSECIPGYWRSPITYACSFQTAQTGRIVKFLIESRCDTSAYEDWMSLFTGKVLSVTKWRTAHGKWEVEEHRDVCCNAKLDAQSICRLWPGAFRLTVCCHF